MGNQLVNLAEVVDLDILVADFPVQPGPLLALAGSVEVDHPFPLGDVMMILAPIWAMILVMAAV